MKIDPIILSAAAHIFELHISDLRPLGGQEGMALEFKRDGTPYILKITPKSKDNPAEVEQLEAKLDFIRYLAENDARVAGPVPTPQGKWVDTVTSQDKLYLVNALTKAEGRHIDLNDPLSGTPEFFQAWGKTMGRMHALATTYSSWQKKPGVTTVSDWQDEQRSFAAWCQYDAIRAKWMEIGEQLATLPQERDSFGLIHNDLHPWNFMVDAAGQITVIDFDVCTYHWFVKDIAVSMFSVNWTGNPGKGRSKDAYLTEFFQNFMRGYETEHHLDSSWLAHLPLFLKHHQILLHTVFTDEWKTRNPWQANVLERWEREILNDTPVVSMLFS